VIAGHSRGALHAARFAAAHADRIAALVLMGTSHPRDRDLSALPIPIMKIVATNDGVVGDAQFDRARLPASTMWVRIEGGNHAQFGFYAPYQLFDGRATISRRQQQDQVLAAFLTLLEQLPHRP
jgi:pimeloyl-ACP methyl ester carboxylesterase